MKIILPVFFAAFALLGSACTTHTVERTTRTQTVVSEEPVLGQPAHAAPRP